MVPCFINHGLESRKKKNCLVDDKQMLKKLTFVWGGYLQYSSQILKHLCDFLLPQCWFGITVISVLQNSRGSTLGKERGTFEWERRCQEWMFENLEKIQDKWLLFQRFVTSIVFSRRRETVAGRYMFFFPVHEVKLKGKTVCWIIFRVWQNDRCK